MVNKNTIIDIIAEALNVDRDKINEDLTIGGIPEWDSVGNLAIINALEENFHVEFPIEDLFELNSVKSFIEKLSNL